MPEDQAEVLANGQSDLYARLVTKEHFEFTLTHELEKLRVELKHELDQHKVANRQTLKELELTLKLELETNKTELINGTKTDYQTQRHRGHQPHSFVGARKALLSALSPMWVCPEVAMTTRGNKIPAP